MANDLYIKQIELLKDEVREKDIEIIKLKGQIRVLEEDKDDWMNMYIAEKEKLDKIKYLWEQLNNILLP